MSSPSEKLKTECFQCKRDAALYICTERMRNQCYVHIIESTVFRIFHFCTVSFFRRCADYNNPAMGISHMLLQMNCRSCGKSSHNVMTAAVSYLRKRIILRQIRNCSTLALYIFCAKACFNTQITALHLKSMLFQKCRMRRRSLVLLISKLRVVINISAQLQKLFF